VWVTSSLTKALTPTAVALGNFDGVHLGHQRVIQPVLNFVGASHADNLQLRRLSPPRDARDVSLGESFSLPVAENKSLSTQNSKLNGQPEEAFQSALVSKLKPQNYYATVVTFNPHPQEFFTGKRRTLLTPLNEKVQQLLCLGVEQLVLLPFDRELAALSPQEFVEKILVQQLHAQQISVGQDFRFGWQRSGTATDLQAIAATFGIPVTIVPLQNFGGDSPQETLRERISSSSIRQALEQGDLQRAKTLLGRPYTLTGLVVKGQQLGRTIGFPTANIQLPLEKFLPRQGVYAVRVLIGNESRKGSGAAGEKEREILSPSPLTCKGVMNIGCRPTVNGTNPSVEVHLLDWSGDLYGQTLTVQLEKFLRPEQKFASLEALKEQIQADCAIARAVLTLES
jgi:riboflavin kinase/FMN adenylyltransferase